MSATPRRNFFDDSLWAQSLSTVTVGAAGRKAGAIYVAPKTGNIRYVGVPLAGSTTPGTLDARIETVSASRLPSGSLFGTNTNATFTSGSANSYTWVQATADAAVTAGQAVAASVVWSATANVTINYTPTTRSLGSPFGLSDSAGSGYTISRSAPCVGLKYDDGTIIQGVCPVASLATSTLLSGSATNERATVFTPEAACTCFGAKLLLLANAAGSTFDVSLYSGTSTTALATASVPANVIANLFNGDEIEVIFPAAVSLTAGQAYRLGVKATHASNSITVYRYLFPSTAERDVVMGQATSDTRGGGAWAGETTTTSEMIAPLIDTVTAGAGGVSRSRVVNAGGC